MSDDTTIPSTTEPLDEVGGRALVEAWVSVQETAIAAKMSLRLVEEYHRLFDDYAVTNNKFDALLNGAKGH